MNDKFKNIFNCAFVFSIFLFTMFILSYIGFIFKIPVNKFYFIISSIVSIILFYILNFKNLKIKKDIFLNLAFILIPLISSIFLSLYFYDNSWDGHSYHQGAIFLLKTGWNPIYDPVSSKILQPSISESLEKCIWIGTYPKGMELISANFYTLLNNIEIGKILNFLSTWISFFLCVFALSKFKSVKLYQNILISLLLVFNPVAIYQLKTYYVDFFTYYFFLNLIMLVVIKTKDENLNNFSDILMIINLTFLANVKLGGLVNSFVFLFFYLIYLLTKKEKLKSYSAIVISFITLLIITGINPYFTNLEQKHHPLYPLAGKEKRDIMTSNTPDFFLNHHYLVNLFYSTFGGSVNYTIKQKDGDEIRLKFPFQIKKEAKFDHPDMRSGGFGYFWGGILILSLLLMFLSKNEKTQDKKLYYFIMSLILSSVLLNPYCWWARYVPIFS